MLIRATFLSIFRHLNALGSTPLVPLIGSDRPAVTATSSCRTRGVLLALTMLLGVYAEDASAEKKVMSSQATYTMGDGETASFAEAMVLQKAKQRALEEAGTYVEAYTKAINQDLTVEEIKTIAGGVMNTEVVSLKRTLVGDGVRFDIQIKAEVQTDNVESLVQRIRGTTMPKEYEQLQKKYLSVTKELGALKESVAAISAQSAKDASPQLDQVREKIRDLEREFRQAQTSEKTLYKRILSGDELATELQRQVEADRQRREQEAQRRLAAEQAVNHLIATLEEEGHDIDVGKPTVESHGARVGLNFPVRAKASTAGKAALQEFSKVQDGLEDDDCKRLESVIHGLGLRVVVTLRDGSQYSAEKLGFHSYKKNLCWYDLKSIVSTKDDETTVTVDLPSDRIAQVVSVEGVIGRASMAAKSSSGKPSARPSLTEDLTRELDDELRKIKSVQLPPKVPSIRSGDSTLKVASVSPRANAYLNNVRTRISSFWSPPSVSQAYAVVIKFRLHRNGTVTGISIEQSSGNEFYDLEGKRAVVSAQPLPPFPADITEPYFDAHMSFTAAEP